MSTWHTFGVCDWPVVVKTGQGDAKGTVENSPDMTRPKLWLVATVVLSHTLSAKWMTMNTVIIFIIDIDSEGGYCRFCKHQKPCTSSRHYTHSSFLCSQGYVVRISGGNDKQGFPMKQGVLTHGRVRLLLSKGHSCYRPRRTGERKRKSVRGCIVDANLSVLNLVIVKKGKI